MLFSKWYVWYPEWALSLLSCTALLLFLPKLLCLGTWEQIFYYELDGRRAKHALIKIIGE